jgi:hypothetical protein
MTAQTAILMDMLNQNTQLTGSIKVLTERLESLMLEVHRNIVVDRAALPDAAPSSVVAG